MNDTEQRIRELAEKASTGPWRASIKEHSGDNWPITYSLGTSGIDGKDYHVSTDGVHCSEFDRDAKTDAEFIAACRTGVPALLSLIDQERAKYQKAMRALESLTPSGSEFVNDVQRCVTYAREKQTSLFEAMKRAIKARHEAELALGEAEARASRAEQADHHARDRERAARTPQESYEFINSDHPCCLPIGDVSQILHVLDDAQKQIEDARTYILESAPDDSREWSKDDSLAIWIHNFGKDVAAEQVAEQATVTACRKVGFESLAALIDDYTKLVNQLAAERERVIEEAAKICDEDAKYALGRATAIDATDATPSEILVWMMSNHTARILADRIRALAPAPSEVTEERTKP